MQHPVLEEKINEVNVIARIYDIDYTNGNTRLYLNDLEKLKPSNSHNFSSKSLNIKFNTRTWLANSETYGWLLDNYTKVSNQTGEETNYENVRMRITSKSNPNVRIGDKVLVRAALIPLPPPK